MDTTGRWKSGDNDKGLDQALRPPRSEGQVWGNSWSIKERLAPRYVIVRYLDYAGRPFFYAENHHSLSSQQLDVHLVSVTGSQNDLQNRIIISFDPLFGLGEHHARTEYNWPFFSRAENMTCHRTVSSTAMEHGKPWIFVYIVPFFKEYPFA